MSEQAKNKLMGSLPPLLRQILPAGIAYDESTNRFRKDDGQFTSTAEAQKNVVTRQAASKLSEGLTELLFQFNRMSAYTSNLEAIKVTEFEAIKDASREADIESSLQSDPISARGLDASDILSSIKSALGSLKNSSESIISQVLGAALTAAGLWLAMSSILKTKNKDEQQAVAKGDQQLKAAEQQLKSDKDDERAQKLSEKQNKGPTRGSGSPSGSDAGGPPVIDDNGNNIDDQPVPVSNGTGSYGGYGKTALTDKHLENAPGLSSLDVIFSGGRETDKGTRGGVRHSDSVGIRKIHPVTKKKNVFHAGTDYAAQYGTRINAVAEGRVTDASSGHGLGNFVDILHGIWEGKSVVTRYAHLSAITTTLGAMVGRGQKIGEMGSLGLSTGSHLHFELIIGGRTWAPNQDQVNYVMSHVIGETKAESAPNWNQSQGAGPKVASAIQIGSPVVQVASNDNIMKLMPATDASTGLPIIRSSDIRTAYNNFVNPPQVSSPAPAPSDGRIDPRPEYMARLMRVAAG